ncbi:unnamed protein product, partial [Cyprideis torosa]
MDQLSASFLRGPNAQVVLGLVKEVSGGAGDVDAYARAEALLRLFEFQVQFSRRRRPGAEGRRAVEQQDDVEVLRFLALMMGTGPPPRAGAPGGPVHSTPAVPGGPNSFTNGSGLLRAPFQSSLSTIGGHSPVSVTAMGSNKPAPPPKPPLTPPSALPHAASRLSEPTLIQEGIYLLAGGQAKHLKVDHVSGALRGDRSLLSPAQFAFLSRFAEMGFLYNEIRRACENLANGRVGSGFCSALSEKIQEWLHLVAELEDSFSRSKGDARTWTFHHVNSWLRIPHRRLRELYRICQTLKGCSGGVIICRLHSLAQVGDPHLEAATQDLMRGACRPLMHMLRS